MKVLTIAMAFTPVLLTTVGHSLLKQLGLPTWLSLLSLGGCMVAAAALMWKAPRAATAQMAGRVMLRHGWCASCGYSLAGVVAATDGCCVCPECGAAWARS